MAGEIKILEFFEGVAVTPPIELLSSVAIKTADYTATTSDDYIEIVASANTVDITIPLAASNSGRQYVIKAADITFQSRIVASGADTIDGSANYLFTTQYESIKLISNGIVWRII